MVTMNWLYCWELGSGFGHLRRMQSVSSQLRAQGHSVQWRVPRPYFELARTLWSAVQAGPAVAVRQTVAAPAGMAEILQNEGWGEPAAMTAWQQAWAKEFANFDRVVLDFAPNALFAALANGRAVDVVGTGFYVPPNTQPWPLIRDDNSVYPDRVHWSEQHLVETVSRWLPEVDQGLCQLFHHDRVRNHLVTTAALDHYPRRQGETYLGVPTGFEGTKPAWSGIGSRRLFIYAKPFPQLAHLLRVAGAADTEVSVHGGRAVRELVDQLDLPAVQFEPAAVDERELANSGAMLINHAGHDGTAKALMAGVPLLQIPLNIEQSLVAKNAKQLGASAWVGAQQAAEFEGWLGRGWEGFNERAGAAQRWGRQQTEPDRVMQHLMDRLVD